MSSPKIKYLFLTWNYYWLGSSKMYRQSLIHPYAQHRHGVREPAKLERTIVYTSRWYVFGSVDHPKETNHQYISHLATHRRVENCGKSINYVTRDWHDFFEAKYYKRAWSSLFNSHGDKRDLKQVSTRDLFSADTPTHAQILCR